MFSVITKPPNIQSSYTSKKIEKRLVRSIMRKSRIPFIPFFRYLFVFLSILEYGGTTRRWTCKKNYPFGHRHPGRLYTRSTEIYFWRNLSNRRPAKLWNCAVSLRKLARPGKYLKAINYIQLRTGGTLQLNLGSKTLSVATQKLLWVWRTRGSVKCCRVN